MILFLDFDGVLHSEPCRSRDAFGRLPLVESILADFPAVEIVVSSAWRLDWVCEAQSVQELRKHFSFEIAPRVVGVTPDHRLHDRSAAPGDLGAFLREWECQTWLSKNRVPGTPWLALDDRPGWFRPDSPNVMIVDSYSGFTEDNEEELRTRLAVLHQQSQAQALKTLNHTRTSNTGGSTP